MIITKRQSMGYFVTVILIAIFAWFLQARITLNIDVRWLMIAADRLMAGGSYHNDFFETNPPLIIYLYCPAAWLAKVSSLSLAVAIRIYVFSLAFMSLMLCQRFIATIIQARDAFVAYIIFIALAILFFIMPMGELGQREHLLIIFVMPYLFAVSNRLLGNEMNKPLGIVIGVIAGAAFAIKPHYLAALIFVELYYLVNKKTLFACLRIETLAMAGFMLTYLVMTLLFHRDYLTIITPFVIRYYYLGYAHAWREILFDYMFVFCFVPLLFCWVLRDSNPYAKFTNTMIAALLGFAIGYVAQRMPYYYHLYPMYAIAVILLAMMYSLLIGIKSVTQRQKLNLCLFGLVVLLYTCWSNPILWINALFHPITFFAPFVVVFAMLFYNDYAEQKYRKTLSAIITILCLAVSYYEVVMSTSWHAHRFVLTVLLLFTLFLIFIPGNKMSKSTYTQRAILGVILLTFPVLVILTEYTIAINRYDSGTNTLTEFIRAKVQQKTTYYFSTAFFWTPRNMEPNSVSRFPFFWMLPGMLNSSVKNNNDNQYFIDMVASDLVNKKPDYVFVDVSKEKLLLSGMQFDYLAYFLKNSHFQFAWKEYHYLTTVDTGKLVYGDEPRFTYQVYQRNI